MFKYLVILMRKVSAAYSNTAFATYLGKVKSRAYLFHLYMLGELPREGDDTDQSNENKYAELLYWLGEVLGYGLLINIPLWVLLQWRFNPFTILSYGIIWYLIARYRGKV